MGPRFFYPVDGANRIHPSCPNTPFRYLGVWLTMDLDWGKQIRVLDKMVSDWKRPAIVGNMDPAILKSSVVELLVPRMELSLLFANVTKKACIAWTSTI